MNVLCGELVETVIDQQENSARQADDDVGPSVVVQVAHCMDFGILESARTEAYHQARRVLTAPIVQMDRQRAVRLRIQRNEVNRVIRIDPCPKDMDRCSTRDPRRIDSGSEGSTAIIEVRGDALLAARHGDVRVSITIQVVEDDSDLARWRRHQQGRAKDTRSIIQENRHLVGSGAGDGNVHVVIAVQVRGGKLQCPRGGGVVNPRQQRQVALPCEEGNSPVTIVGSDDILMPIVVEITRHHAGGR